jgi:heme-degrading monooxygenase HmoA
MVTIAPFQEKKILTVINIFTVEPENQERLINVLIEADQLIKMLPGYISTNVHRSLDGTKVTNYTQWENAEALDAMLHNPAARTHLQELYQLAVKVEPTRYEVIYSAEAH